MRRRSLQRVVLTLRRCPRSDGRGVIAAWSRWRNLFRCTPNWMDEVLARHTGKSVEEVNRDTERDNFMSAEDAMAYGLVDMVVESRDLPARRYGLG